jgi:hypothetical protein
MTDHKKPPESSSFAKQRLAPISATTVMKVTESVQSVT